MTNKRPRTEGETSSGTANASATPAANAAAPAASGAPPQTDDLVLELSLRGNLLIQQQRRIVQLEQELQKAWLEIESLRSQIVDYEREKQRSDSEKKPQTRYWTPEEHNRFLDALEKFGPKDVKSIATYVGTRNATQVRTHAQKYYLRLDREKQSDSEKKNSEEGDKNGGKVANIPTPVPAK